MQTEAQKSAQRVFHAGVGVTDFAVEAVRDYAAGTQKRVADGPQERRRLRAARVQQRGRQDGQRPRSLAVPARVQKLVDVNVSAATDTYGDLVKRGQSLAGRIRRQQSTQDTVAAAETTVTKAKTTAYPGHQGGQGHQAAAAKKRTAAKSSAKATGTAAKKTSPPAPAPWPTPPPRSATDVEPVRRLSGRSPAPGAGDSSSARRVGSPLST